MAIAADRCTGCERSQAEGSRVALAHERTMNGGSPGDTCGSLMSSPRLRLATVAALFSAFVLLAEPRLADNHQDVVGLGCSGASFTITRTTKETYFVTSYSRVTSVSISLDGSMEGTVADNGSRCGLRRDDQSMWGAEFVAPDPVSPPLRNRGRVSSEARPQTGNGRRQATQM